MKSPVLKRSVVIDGHKTSVSLEDPFWNDLKEIAYVQRNEAFEDDRGNRQRTTAQQLIFERSSVCVGSSPYARGSMAIFFASQVVQNSG